MDAPLLHLVTRDDWATATGEALVPPSLAQQGFVHLSTPAQVALPATRLFRGRTDVLLLVLDPEKLGAEVRWEPGLPGDPPDMRFPHLYGALPLAAVSATLDYPPGPDGSFAAPSLP